MTAVRLRTLKVLMSLCVLGCGVFLFSASALAAAPPAIEEAFTTNVTATSATFHAVVNPGGSDTTYRFEYARDTGSYELVHGPEGEPLTGAEGDAGEGAGGVPVEVHVQGLAPTSSYRFRLVADNSVEEIDGADTPFTTQSIGGFSLPDGRQWEMVSPPQKQGAVFNPIAETGVIQAAANGDAMTYLASVPTELELSGFTNRAQVFSTRGPDGWSSTDLSQPLPKATGKSIGFGQEYRFFSEDLSYALLQPFGEFTPLSDEASEQTPYLHTDFADSAAEGPCSNTCFRPLVSGCPSAGQACAPSIEEHADVPPGTVFGGEFFEGAPCKGVTCAPVFVGATPDLSHVVIEAFVGLTRGTSGGLYEWSDGKLTFIGEGERFQGISKDGSLVFLEEITNYGQLFVFDLNTGETAALDSGQEIASLAAISNDGSKAILRVRETGELRECEVMVTAGKLTCNVSNLEGNVAGVVGMSTDGSWLYFASSSILTNVPNRNGERAVSGSCGNEDEGVCNLYSIHDGSTGWEAPRLVAELSGGDIKDWAGNGGGPSNELGSRTARISPNGEWLAFMSRDDRVSYDTRDALSGHLDEEVYLYNSRSDALSCASCNPTDARPVGVEYNKLNGGLVSGDRVWSSSTWLAANIPGWTPLSDGEALYQSRYLSSSGRLFFNSSDALVPQDVNGVEDVYEYEPSGVGGCDSSNAMFSHQSGGCVDLVSSGTSGEESGFLDTSESGGDVFFLTAAKLVKRDFDTALDVYDAHECSVVSPCSPQAVSSPPPCVTGDACKPAPTPQPPIFGEPSSATFSGAGNVTPSTPPSAVKPRALTRAQKLARALRECQEKKKHHKQRAACERQARKRYAAKAAGETNAKRRGK